MRREPSLTLQGALAILNHYEPGIIGKLDKMLGGVILASGLGAGIAAVVAVPALAPLAIFAAAWGWVEQKNEAIELLRQAIGSISHRLLGTAGVERRKLIAAAHTTIVVAATFEAIREHIGKEAFKQVALTQQEKKYLIASGRDTFRAHILDTLYASEIPAPSSSCGFEENIHALYPCVRTICDNFVEFFSGLALLQRIRLDVRAATEAAVERYRSHYLALAATVPEFCVWAMLGEHAATRTEIANLGSDLASALDANRDALGRVEALLALAAGRPASEIDVCAVMRRANRAVLDQPIVPMDAERYDTQVIFPPIEQIYINPRYRVAQATADVKPADETWWADQQAHDDIDLSLAGHIMAPDATRFPLLLLGHPGAGKSLLTKVLAARLATSGYTVVRVPLRQVGANAPILDQIQQALDHATNKRVDWWRLAEQSRDTVRVVLLDGLDELLQASSSDRSGYLQEVMEFQRIEADQEQPLVVVVTSRTVVADRVEIPAGTTIVRLDFFDDPDIALWLQRWREANDELIATGTVRELTLDAALSQAELARQPLLLLMLALYSADPSFPALDANLSTADLYHRLLDNFARREVAKKTDHKLSVEETELRVQDQLDRLAVAALGMFNRGRQDISEADLGVDLAALSTLPPNSSRPIELGQRLIAEFFFVHAAQAHLLATTLPDDDDPTAGQRGKQSALRSYEFLHATFSEYLVASKVMNELADVAHTALGGRRGPREPEDDLLFALLSHQPLAVRRSTLNFATEIFAGLIPTERDHVLDVLDLLVNSYRCRHGSDRYSAYRPVPADRIRELAAYSANLVTLRVTLEPEGEVPLAKIFGSADVAGQWHSMVTLWRSGLDVDGQQAMASSLGFSGSSVHADPIGYHGPSNQGDMLDVLYASLAGDTRLARWIRHGMATCDDISYFMNDRSDWYDMTLSWLIPNLAAVNAGWMIAQPLPANITSRQAANIAQLLMQLIGSRSSHDQSAMRRFVNMLFNLPREFEFDSQALAAVVMRHPDLAKEFPLLADPDTYGDDLSILRLSGTADVIWPKANDKDELSAWLTSDAVTDPTPPEIRHLTTRLLNYFAGNTPVELVDINAEATRPQQR